MVHTHESVAFGQFLGSAIDDALPRPATAPMFHVAALTTVIFSAMRGVADLDAAVQLCGEGGH